MSWNGNMCEMAIAFLKNKETGGGFELAFVIHFGSPLALLSLPRPFTRSLLDLFHTDTGSKLIETFSESKAFAKRD
ncbi:hypothetical protein Csa_014862 [Cucumis sativus]|uniref:Uncharacterized protein n=1 Tax=Cucumis sativus TaxID=3659 RepID=A0A0A0KUE4_CUCSA|nr:hypothetical protein Csa_014862 [Cucumis sativus]